MKFAFAIAPSNYSYFQPDSSEVDTPLGVLHLATQIQNKAQVRIFDGQLSTITPESLADKIIEWEPDIVGFSVNFSTVAENTRRMARYIRSKAPNILLIFGGNYATFQANSFIEQEYCDTVFLHEAEISLPIYIDWFLDRSKKLPDGILHFTCKDSELVRKPFISYIHDLNSLPLNNYELFDNPQLYAKSLISSRGCPYSCIYCSTSKMWKRWRCRSATNVVDEMARLFKTFNAKQIYFADDIFIVDKKRVYAMCDTLINNGHNIKWGFSTRIETLHDEMIPVLAKAGVTGIFLGVESGSNRVLSQMSRRYTQKEIISKVNLLADYGITATTSFILGLPYENHSDVQETFKTMRSVRTHRVLLNIFTPLVGTESTINPERYGIVLHKDFDAERAVVGHGYVHFKTSFLSSDDIRKYWLEGQSIVMDKGRQRNAFESKMEQKRYGLLNI